MKEFWANWDIWSPDREPLPKTVKDYRKISLCTTCMNRASDLKNTLIKNIEDNLEYPNIEFVILNYNSSDDMHFFMQTSAVRKYLKLGVLKYYVTHSPHFYSMAHSRNVAFLSSTGQIVINVDADNYTGFGFASFVNKLAELCPRRAFFAKGKRMMHGRVGMYKDEFVKIGGYNEDFVGYGYDDHDLMIRAMNSGYKLMWWAGVSPVDFTQRIPTPRCDVGKHMPNPNWRETEHYNKVTSLTNISAGHLVANIGKTWGQVSDLQQYKS